MGATSVTRSYTSIVASVLDKVKDKVEDQITRNNKYFFGLKKNGNWKKVSSGGDRYRVSLMYELGAADSYSSFGQIDVTPSDGITSAFFDWRQSAGWGYEGIAAAAPPAFSPGLVGVADVYGIPSIAQDVYGVPLILADVYGD